MLTNVMKYLSHAARSQTGKLENSEKMKLLVVCLLFVAAISVATSQNRYSAKQGSCPPALPVQFCGHSCFVDSHCAGIGKCCPTQCGGSICSVPVTMIRPSQSGKKSFVAALRQIARSETIMIAQSISFQSHQIEAL